MYCFEQLPRSRATFPTSIAGAAVGTACPDEKLHFLQIHATCTFHRQWTPYETYTAKILIVIDAAIRCAILSPTI